MAVEVEGPTLTVLERIQSFIYDSAYTEAIENAASFNTRLSIERRMRMPFLDSHTGVAQRHTDLFKNERQRMPGLQPGQVYTYPAKPWCKRKRQYLMNWMNPKRSENENGETNNGDSQPINEDSKDSIGLKDENAKDSWYYDDEMIEMGDYEEPDPDSDYDYEENYRGRKKKRGSKATGRSSRSKASTSSPAVEPPCIGGRGGRGRKRALLYDMDNDKPFACERGNRRGSRQSASLQSGGSIIATSHHGPSSSGLSGTIPPKNIPSVVAPIDSKKDIKDDKPASPSAKKQTKEAQSEREYPIQKLALSDDKPRANPSPYCDFCLGDQTANKKTMIPEELVSCADCGRSGHPTCLQFTPNMIVSVRKYRWQCIECKCCSICGTSDNDDQLLFCDDCDRGYHMYCLMPRLTSPPEGSWSCRLCLIEFHGKK